MLPDKEKILEELQKENPHSIPVFKAMEQYATEVLSSFILAEGLATSEENAMITAKSFMNRCQPG